MVFQLERTLPPIILDWSTYPEIDGEPMAETLRNQTTMINGQFAARRLLEQQGRTNVAVGGNQFIYYTEGNGHDHISPDIYIALDEPPGGRPKWQTWVEGKFPDIVFEISSPSTQDVDLGHKVLLYGRLGAKEYYIFDPQLAMRPALRAFRRQGARLVRVALSPGPELRVFSPLLHTDLVVREHDLRIIDPATGEPFLTPEEEAVARRAAEQAQRAAEEQAVQEVAARYKAEQALQESDERAARAEAALQAALAELARRISDR